MTPTKAAIIGLGNIAPMHIKSLNEIKVEIAAVCDKDLNLVEEFAAEIGCRPYTDYEKMLDEGGFNVLHICLPHFLHAPIAIAAFQKGIHVLCEKPLATTLSDAKAMVEAAEQAGLAFGVIFQNRFGPGVKLIKQTLESGALGTITGGKFRVAWCRGESYYKGSDWRGYWRTGGGGVIINQSIHCFDLMNFFLGEPTSVKASIANLAHPTIEVEDVAEGVISYGDVQVSFLVTTNNHCDEPVSLELIGEKGDAKLVGEHACVTFSDGTQKTAEQDVEAQRRFGMKTYWGVSHILQISDFYKCLYEGRKHLPDGMDGARTQALVNGTYESAKIGKEFVF